MFRKELEEEGKECENRAYHLIERVRNGSIVNCEFIVDFLSLVSYKVLEVDKELAEHGALVIKMFGIINIIKQEHLYTPRPLIRFGHVPSTTFFSPPENDTWLVNFEVYRGKKIYHKLTKTFVLENRYVRAFITGMALFRCVIYDRNNKPITY